MQLNWNQNEIQFDVSGGDMVISCHSTFAFRNKEAFELEKGREKSGERKILSHRLNGMKAFCILCGQNLMTAIKQQVYP